MALSDELLMTSQPLEIIRRDRTNKLRKTLSRIEELCESYGVALIVLGLPLNMDDSAGFRAEDTMKFREDVERRTGLPVVMSDERLTPVEAYEIMAKMEIRREDRGRYVEGYIPCEGDMGARMEEGQLISGTFTSMADGAEGLMFAPHY